YTPYFPTPINLVYTKEEVKPRLRFSGYLGRPFRLPICTDQGERKFWGWIRPQADDTALKVEEITGFLHPKWLKDWLSGKEEYFREDLINMLPQFFQGFEDKRLGSEMPPMILKPESLFVHEIRTGLGLEATRKQAQEGLLYTIYMMRPPTDTGFLLRVRSRQTDLLDKLPGPALLGGWRKQVTLYRLDPEQVAWLDDFPLVLNEPCKYIVLYFYTLSVYALGHLPVWIDHINRNISWPFVPHSLPECKLMACYSYKPFHISGWDLQKGPKPMQRAVRPGAVWFLGKADGDDFSSEETKAIMERLGNRPTLSDQPAAPGVTAAVPPARMGFGLYFAGIAQGVTTI
ncbi:MAG: hypothetical protein JRI50_11605, partial [Deltaproteobacteria bacterium]|nr:hypothetical protein [Deltaproteobacteria bacterium]